MGKISSYYSKDSHSNYDTADYDSPEFHRINLQRFNEHIIRIFNCPKDDQTSPGNLHDACDNSQYFVVD